MSEALILAFQSQLSIVMETVMKTAVYEVTRLVEEGFLEEVRRRKQEVELLRLRLEWAERKLKGVSQRGTCADCGKTGLPNEEPEDITSAILLSKCVCVCVCVRVPGVRVYGCVDRKDIAW